MRGGRLDRRVKILKRLRTRSPSSGEFVETFPEIAEVWARKLEGRPLERYAAAQRINEIEVGFEMRWNPGLLAMTPDENRLRYGEQEFWPVGVVEIGRREGVVVLCRGRAEGVTAQGVEPVA